MFAAEFLSIIGMMVGGGLFLGLAVFWILGGFKSAEKQGNKKDDANLEIYRNQLFELKSQLDKSEISQAEYDDGRIEIGRRIKTQSGKLSQIEAGLSQKAKNMSFLVIILAALLSLGFYMKFGSPNKAQQPFKQRIEALKNTPLQNLDDNEIMVLLSEQAKLNPKDPMPHLFMGKFMVAMGKDSESLRAFQAALRRDKNNPEVLAELGGVIYRLNDNKIDSSVINALTSALKIDSNNLSAQYYLGLIAWNEGKKEISLNIWQDAWQNIAPAAPEKSQFIERIVSEISQISAPKNAEAPITAMAQGANPQAFIKAMMANREEKLRQDPSDLGLRISLAKAKFVMGENEKALKILKEGQNYALGKPIVAAILKMAENFQAAPQKENMQ